MVRYAFDDFELDTEAYELLRAGKRVKVQPKVLQLIRYLVQNHGRFVSKEEILAALWPNEHVTESSLFVCVRAARIALGQSNSQNRPIATLRGAGYRFIGELTELQKTAAHASARPGAAHAVAGNAAGNDDFVGRQSVMYALSNALGRATTGRGQFVILSGEPGIGKTRCAQELSDLAARDRVRVLAARCLEAEGAPAFWPWVQLLRQAADQGDPEWSDEARALLEHMVPVAGARQTAQTETDAAWASERFWLFDRVVRVLVAVAEAAPCLLMIDDLQWADEASLRLLHLFVSDMSRVPCLLVATLREPRPDSDEARERTLRRVARSAAVIELGGLSEAETAQLLSAVAGSADAARLAPELHKKTAGNPLFLVELSRLVLAGGGAPASAPSASQLPRVIRDVIRSRLEVLDDKARAVLRAASVFGGDFDLNLLAELLPLPRATVLAAIDAAIASKLIARAPSDARFSFAHDLVREAVYDDLTQIERVDYHGRAGRALMNRGGERQETELAYHFHMALAGGTHEPALRHAASAGGTALRMFAFETAARCYRWALAALDQHPYDDPRIRAELTLGLATAVLALGRSSEAREIYKSAVEIAERHRFGDLLAVAGTWLRHNVATAPMPDPFSLHVLERALELIGDDHPQLRANVLSRLAWIWPNCEDMPKCKALAAESLALARTLRSDSTLLAALAATLYSRTGPDDVDALLATADEVFSVERANGRLTWFTAEAHFLRYHAHLYRAERAEADRALSDFGEIVGRLRMPEPILLYDRMCAQRILEEGRLDEAEGLFKEQHARGRRLGLVYADLYFALQMLIVHGERGGFGAVPGVLAAEGWNIASTPVFRATRLFVAAELGRAHELRDVWNALSQDDFAAVPRDLNHLLALSLLSYAAVALGDRARAHVLYERLTPYARFGTPSLFSTSAGAVAYHLAQLAEFLGERAQAAAHYQTALEVNDRMGFAGWGARTRLGLARLLLEGSAPERNHARALLEHALTTAREHGLQPVIAGAEPLLRAATG